MRFIIDPEGTRLEARRFVTSNPALELVERGYVLVELKRMVCFVWLDSARMSARSEAALYYFICDCPCVRFAVYFTPDRHTARIFASRDDAIRVIADELAHVRRDQSTRFTSRPVELASLAPGSPLQQLLDDFAKLVAGEGLPGARKLLRRVLHDRYLVVEQEGRTTGLVLREVGSGYSGFDPHWSRTAAGRALEEQPDIHYGRWLAKGYSEVLEHKQPAAQEVDAAIFRAEYGRRRFAYRRLLLPFFDDKGRNCLLSASVADSSIDLGID